MMFTEIKKPINLLRKPKLLQKIQISNAALYSWMQKSSPYYVPTFPKPIRISGGRCVFWIEDEIDRWLEIYMTQRNEKDEVSIAKIELNQKNSIKYQNRQSHCHIDIGVFEMDDRNRLIFPIHATPPVIQSGDIPKLIAHSRKEKA